MGKIPTKPGWWVWSDFEGDPKEIVEVNRGSQMQLRGFSTGVAGGFPLDRGIWHHEVALDKPASPWRPADEPPVVPEGKGDVLILIRLAPRPSVGVGVGYSIQIFRREWDWYGFLSDKDDAWMPIPPHGEGGAE